MKPLKQDLSAFTKRGFEKPPLGVKFLFFRPKSIKQLAMEKNLSFCEMLKEGWEADEPFYFGKDNNETCVGKILLGMEDMAPFAESGQIGDRLEIFQEPRANYKFYQHVPKFERGIINYVAFAQISKLTFEPDVLIITATHSQSEVIMRAMTYSTGELYQSKTTPVMGCAWTYIYPFQSGNVNFIVPDMVHGMNSRKIFSANSILIAIPYNWIRTIAQNLQEMKLHLDAHADKERYLAEFGAIVSSLVQESQDP